MTITNSKPAYIGVDVSADTLDVYIRSTQEHFILENAEKALRKWAKTLAPSSMIVLESTGGYENKAREILAEYKIPCHRAHPNQVHNFAKYKGYRAKTDRLDARILAEYGEVENVAPTAPVNPLQSMFRALVVRRAQLTQSIAAEKNRNNKTLSELCVEYVESTVHFLEAQKKQIEAHIIQLMRSSAQLEKRASLLGSLKGVGPVTIISLLAFLPQLGEVSRTQIAALVGLAPYNRDSGKKEGSRHISGGHFELRKTLYMAAMTAIRHNWVMKEFYERLRSKGKQHKVAMVAVMRKMLITLNQMMKEQRMWKFAED